METIEEKPLVKDLNEHIVCPLCRGYLIDATTLVECLHSFCRGCIVRRLSSGARACPVCSVATSPPLMPDPKLQRLVYLVVPGLFRSELERRRHFRLVNPQCPPLPAPLGAVDLTLDDFVSLSLCEFGDTAARKDLPGCNGNEEDVAREQQGGETDSTARGRATRYLKCPAGVTVRHLVRLLTLKRGWEEANASVNNANRIEIMWEESNPPSAGKEMRTLDLSWTLLDLACIFGWKRVSTADTTVLTLQEAPMRLFYRITQKEETESVSRISECDADRSKMAGSPNMENIQRPPTPPPSPKTIQEDETRSSAEGRNIKGSCTLGSTIQSSRVVVESGKDVACSIESKTEGARTAENNVETSRAVEVTGEREKETKTKKPRCEVTPVMRAPDPVGLHVSESTKSKELARMEHRKRRKRRNKRVIAEITTTPREDLLKLKVRLTPCPPRITSSAGAGQTKEKLLQMRAVRREKIKTTNVAPQRTTSLSREENNDKPSIAEPEETIEQIIDSIPDEVVRIAQNIGSQDEETNATTERLEQKINSQATRAPTLQKDEPKPESKQFKAVDEKDDNDYPKRDEEILRRLGLVAVEEANEARRDKSKQRAQSNTDKIATLDREKLEKQLRESKANRVRSLLAEKQMRDALKSIMSKTKDDASAAPQSSRTDSTSTVSTTPAACPKKKGPPPLAPLRVVKQSSANFSVGRTGHDTSNTKYEIPLDLSNAGTGNDNVLDLSATLIPLGSFSSSSSVSSSPSSSSSTSSSPYSGSLIPALSPPRQAKPPVNSFHCKPKEVVDQRKAQNTNLMTLSDAAVSLLSGCIGEKTSSNPLVLHATKMGAGKVALRIPQPHQRISGFGMKIKPNLGVRHIPNPQAVVASQYRNQRASYLNAISQQPP